MIESLTKSGFNDDIIYTPVTESNNSAWKKSRKRKIIWFNPPHSMNVETNIGSKIFLKFVKQHFPRNNSFHKIFNKNTIKISYSFMRNLSSIIASYNKSILSPKAKEYGCNCRNKESLIYEATVVNNSDDEKRVYFGASAITFKDWYRNDTRDFNHERYSKCTSSYQSTFGS